MNTCSRSNKLVLYDDNDADGDKNGEPCDCDVQSVNKVAEVLSMSLRIEIPPDAAEVEDNVINEIEKGLVVYTSSSSPGSTSLSEDWSDEGCNEEGFAPNSIGFYKASNSALEATYLNLPVSFVLFCLFN